MNSVKIAKDLIKIAKCILASKKEDYIASKKMIISLYKNNSYIVSKLNEIKSTSAQIYKLVSGNIQLENIKQKKIIDSINSIKKGLLSIYNESNDFVNKITNKINNLDFNKIEAQINYLQSNEVDDDQFGQFPTKEQIKQDYDNLIIIIDNMYNDVSSAYLFATGCNVLKGGESTIKASKQSGFFSDIGEAFIDACKLIYNSTQNMIRNQITKLIIYFYGVDYNVNKLNRKMKLENLKLNELKNLDEETKLVIQIYQEADGIGGCEDEPFNFRK